MQTMLLGELRRALSDPRFPDDMPVTVRVVHNYEREENGAFVSREFAIRSGLTGWNATVAGWEVPHATLHAEGVFE